MNKPLVFNRYRHQIEDTMKNFLMKYSLPLYDMIRYHLGWIDENGSEVTADMGKMLRPTLCLLACESLRENFYKALPAAVSLELIHNFSLIHDDIQDNDTHRRHRPTVWKIWGKAQAINAGTAARIIASQIISEQYNTYTPDLILELLSLFDNTTLRLIEGQYMDISFESREHIDMAEYLQMIRNKTAALMACALKAGSLIGRHDEKIAHAYYTMGISMGMAFQIRDDILGIWSSSHKTGKAEAKDITQKKKSLPIAYILNNAPDSSKKIFLDIYQKPELGTADITTVLTILDDIKARQHAELLVVKYSHEAEKILKSIKINEEHRIELLNIITFLSQNF